MFGVAPHLGGGTHKISFVAQCGSIRKDKETRPVRGCVDGEQLGRNGSASGVKHFNLFSLARKLHFNLNHFRSRPGERIENHDRHAVSARIYTLGVDVRHDLTECSVRDLVRRASDIFQVSLRVEIVHRDSGTGHDVVEMIE